MCIIVHLICNPNIVLFSLVFTYIRCVLVTPDLLMYLILNSALYLSIFYGINPYSVSFRLTPAKHSKRIRITLHTGVKIHVELFAGCEENRPSETEILQVESHESVFGQEIITFRCAAGYTILGNPHVYCVYGNWSQLPQCIGKRNC